MLLLAFTLVFTIAGCGKSEEPNKEEPKKEEPKKEEPKKEEPKKEEPKKEEPKKEAAGASDDIFSFQITLNDVLYTLPTSYAELTKNGWKADKDFAGKTLEPNGRSSYINHSNGNQKILVELVNTTANVLPIEQCSVGIIASSYFKDENQPKMVLPKGITIGKSTPEEVSAAYGKPSEERTNEFMTTYEYKAKQYAEVKLEFDVKTKKLQNITVTNYFTDKPAPTTIATDTPVPAEVTSYKAPASIGDDWKAFNVKYAGNIYHLPAPVAEFIKNGWTINNATNEVIPAKSGAVGLELRKDNHFMRTSIYNYSDKAQPVNNCFITEVVSDEYDAKFPLELPMGISVGKSKGADVIAAYGEATRKEDGASYKIYEYKDGSLDRMITFYTKNDTDLVYKIEVSHSPKKLE